MKRIKLGLVIPSVLLIAIGLTELFFISKGMFVSQLSKVLIYVLLFLGLYLTIRKSHILNYGFILYYLSIPLLMLTLFLGRGGVNRWLNLGFFKLQPSEIAKIGLIFLLSKIISDDKKPLKNRLIKAGIVTFIPFILVMLQPDLGTALTFLFIAFIINWIGGADPSLIRFFLFVPIAMLASAHPLATVIFFSALAVITFVFKEPLYKKIVTLALLIFTSLITPIVWQKVLKPYQRDRLTAFINPEKSKTTEGWQIYQARIALGSGGISGKGPGKGTQKSLAFLPAAHTDFILSSIGEEFGFTGLLLIITLFIIFMRTVLRLMELKEGHEKLIVSGIFSYFIFHFGVNTLSNLSLLPVVGIPLPFITYGGSHVLVEIAAIFTLLKMEV